MVGSDRIVFSSRSHVFDELSLAESRTDISILSCLCEVQSTDRRTDHSSTHSSSVQTSNELGGKICCHWRCYPLLNVTFLNLTITPSLPSKYCY